MELSIDLLKNIALNVYNAIHPILGSKGASKKAQKGAGGDISMQIDLIAENIIINTLENENVSILLISEEVGEVQGICNVLDSLIFLTLENGDFKQAHLYFDRLKQINKKEENQKFINLLFKFDEALIIKKDPNMFNLTKAKYLLKQIINEDIIDFGIYVAALLELCDLLLINLKDTNDLKLLDMIQPYVNQLIEIAKNIFSYSLLAETYLLQAKLELITLDLNEAQRSLIKAHQIAEKYGLNLLNLRILNEQDELQEQFTKWENFKISKAIFADRINLARVDEQLVRMLRKRVHLEKIIF